MGRGYEMPYKSKAQERYFHYEEGKSISKKVVKEFDKASKGKSLPEKVKGFNEKARGY